MPDSLLEVEKVFRQLRRAGFEPEIIYDIGSTGGYWSGRLSRTFPKASFFLFEPLVDFKAHYKRNSDLLLRKRSNFHLFKVALGEFNETAEIFSDEMGWGASLLPTEPVATLTESFTVPVKKLDSIIAERELPIPQLLKMDVQGGELGVLRGGTSLLDRVEVILAEVWFRRAYGPKTPLLGEVSEFLRAFDFSLLELCSQYYSPQRDLTAADAFFMKSSLLRELKLPKHNLVKSNRNWLHLWKQ